MKALKFLEMIKSDGLLDGKCVIYSDLQQEAISELEALQQHIKDLESQLSSNPLQLTCDGCKWENYPDQIFDQIHGCEICSRYKENFDRYTTKDTK